MAKRKPAEITTVAGLVADHPNPRKRTQQNLGMIEDSLRDVGAARSIVIDENGRVLAGNGTIEAAAQAGISKVQVVDADGDTIIAVRRSNLTEAQKTRLGIYDNRTAELAEWDVDVLKGLHEGGIDLAPFEFSEVLKRQITPEATGGQEVTAQFHVLVSCRDDVEQVAMLERFIAEGMTCKALVS